MQRHRPSRSLAVNSPGLPACADTAVISENVYLFAASESLATGVRALIDRPALAKALKLNADQLITLAQGVGFPKK